MLIDWFTVSAQIVNFLVLVWLLKRFLWGRLVAAIDAREAHIAAQLADADQKMKQADGRMQELNARAEDLTRERGEVLARAQREADELRLEMVQQAREAVRKQESAWREDLDREKRSFVEDLRQRIAVEMLAVLRRALKELACADLQRCAVEVFLEKLRAIDESALRQLAAGGNVTVLSAAGLSGETQAEIQAALSARLGPSVPVAFETSRLMSWGLELRSNGRSIGWTPDAYLDSLDHRIREALETQPKVLVG